MALNVNEMRFPGDRGRRPYQYTDHVVVGGNKGRLLERICQR